LSTTRRYKRSSQTRWRWSKDDPQLGFPKPIKIKNRLLYRRRDVEEFERLNEVEALITVEMLVRIFTRLDRIGGVTNSLGLECSLDDRPQ
jgi:predicted DNA-binding transcriptional regulator AlpA